MELTQATLRPRKLFIPRFISTTPQVATTRTRDLSASDVCLFVQSSGLNASQDRTDRWSKSGAVEKPFWRIRLSLTSVCASQDRRRAAFTFARRLAIAQQLFGHDWNNRPQCSIQRPCWHPKGIDFHAASKRAPVVYTSGSPMGVRIPLDVGKVTPTGSRIFFVMTFNAKVQ